MPFEVVANQDTPLSPDWESFLGSIGGTDFVVEVARGASSAIMEIYSRSSITHDRKEDGSPVSEADVAAAVVIEGMLGKTEAPVVCEEGTPPSIQGHSLFWLVDPLDGTKEFLARNGEFSVNIALVAGDEPVVGVIAIPVTGEVYVGVKGRGAERWTNGERSGISNTRRSSSYIAASSRSYGSSEIEAWLERFGVGERLRCGSAIKFCRLAEGKADLYLRLGRTMEWDTAAGQVIIEESGCRLVTLPEQQRLRYGKPTFANSDFVALRADISLPDSDACPSIVVNQS
jgi:3'(2'), 5'-bisphosphate nucleotidase